MNPQSEPEAAVTARQNRHRCSMRAEVDAFLTERNCVLNQDLLTGTPYIGTTAITKKRGEKPPVMFPTYCPFCGADLRGEKP